VRDPSPWAREIPGFLSAGIWIGLTRRGFAMVTVDDEPLAVIAQHLRARSEEFIAELVDATTSQIRVLIRDPLMVDLLQASITENIVAAIHHMEHEVPENAVEAPTAAIVYARALAQRDVPLSALIRAYRIVHARFLDTAMCYAQTLIPTRRVQTIVELVNRSARWVDRICDQVGAAYEQEHDSWVSNRSSLRQQWVAQLLSGGTVDVRRAEEALQYELGAVHVAALLWMDTALPDRQALTLFSRARCQLASALGSVAEPLMVPVDEREVRLWFSLRAPLAIEPKALAAVTHAGVLPIRVALGRGEDGVDGFRRSMAQAERAKAVALAGGHRVPRVIAYEWVMPLALMAGDLAALRDLVACTLDDLAVDDERNGWLRETLREFLAHNRSFAATAEAMTLHRNSIQYRIAQAMRCCRTSLDDADAMLNVQIALDACRWLGPAVLLPASRHAAVSGL
jgi:DNA-binding PucR family transcriptional regulator